MVYLVLQLGFEPGKWLSIKICAFISTSKLEIGCYSYLNASTGLSFEARQAG